MTIVKEERKLKIREKKRETINQEKIHKNKENTKNFCHSSRHFMPMLMDDGCNINVDEKFIQ